MKNCWLKMVSMQSFKIRSLREVPKIEVFGQDNGGMRDGSSGTTI